MPLHYNGCQNACDHRQLFHNPSGETGPQAFPTTTKPVIHKTRGRLTTFRTAFPLLLLFLLGARPEKMIIVMAVSNIMELNDEENPRDQRLTHTSS